MPPLNSETTAKYDSMSLNNIRERNMARVREIDATLAELSPLLERLTKERGDCLRMAYRVRPEELHENEVGSNTFGPGPSAPKAAADGQGFSSIGMFIIDPNTKEA